MKQHHKSPVDYTAEFFLVQERCNLDKLENAVAHDYYHGLRLAIEHLLAFQNSKMVGEMVQHALKTEKIANHQAHKYASFKGMVNCLSLHTSTQVKSSQDTSSSF